MSDSYLEWNENRQNYLKSLLDKLIGAGIESDESGLDNVKDGFKTLYLESFEGLKFRHKYSTLTGYVRKQTDEDLDVLMTNLRIVMKKCDDETVIEKLLKLEDHLSLEISRNASYKQLEESRNTAIKLKNGLDEVDSRISKADGDLDHIHGSINNVAKDLENIKTESSKNNIRLVTVLGMFSAIVLTFTGGMAFLSGSLSGIQDVEVLRLTFFVLLCGFILYNLILLLLSVIERTVGFDLITSNRGYKWMVIAVNATMIAPMAMIALHWSGLLALRIDTSASINHGASDRTWNHPISMNEVPDMRRLALCRRLRPNDSLSHNTNRRYFLREGNGDRRGRRQRPLFPGMPSAGKERIKEARLR